ncbi:MAG: Type 1 glutamine amidotransferase-like domain-containing protein [Anaerolineales bacterium]|nr:Type 1 glutamine amidotransferase-like domain-containing protein [Anaerolineales bacterium]
MNHLLLAGGAEFGGKMREPDLQAIELAGGFDAPICIIPTAAAPDNNHKRAGNNGIRWFQSLGAKNVFSLDVINSKSANDSSLVASIRTSKLVYLLGGFPRFLGETLKNSLCWNAVLEVYKNGGVIGGSSAGAMVMCEYYYDPYEKKLLNGLNLISNACVLPHHNQFGKMWAENLQTLLPNSTLIGIDEETGMISRSASRQEDETDSELSSATHPAKWQVYGRGEVTVYRSESIVSVGRGGNFSLNGI